MTGAPHQQEIVLDFTSYLGSLVIDAERPVSRIYSMDGAALYKITDDHYVCISCTSDECETHRGRAQLERVLPRNWECFFVGVNSDDHYAAYHYGPKAAE